MLQARPPPRELSQDQYYDDQYEDAGYYPPPAARQPVGVCLLLVYVVFLVDLSLCNVKIVVLLAYAWPIVATA